jgi:adenosine deaminase
VGVGVIIAANRTRHPLDARRWPAWLRNTPRGVVGFGLSNDERRGAAVDFERAFAIAHRPVARRPARRRAGRRPACATAWTGSRATRIGHGVRAAEDPALLSKRARRAA